MNGIPRSIGRRIFSVVVAAALLLPALAFSDPSHMTCIANDFGYEQVFARMVDAYGRPGDTLLAISHRKISPMEKRTLPTRGM